MMSTVTAIPTVISPPSFGLVGSLTLAGIASGGLGMAILVERLGGEQDRRAVQPARWLALPLTCLAGALHLDDRGVTWPRLGRAEDSTWEAFSRALQEWWSVSGDVLLLGLFGGLALVAAFRGLVPGRPQRGRISRVLRGLIDAATVLAAVLVASGGLLPASSWVPATGRATAWPRALLLGNSASIGLAALILIEAWRKRDLRPAIDRLERMDLGAVGLQGLCLVGLALDRPTLAAWTAWPALLIPTFVVPVGWVLPLAVRRLAGPRGSAVAAILILLGAVALRYALIAVP